MSTVELKKKRPRRFKTQDLVKIAMLGAIAFLLFWIPFLRFPIIPAVPFLRLDFSNIPALLGGFLMGPLAGIAIEVLRVGLQALIDGSITGFIGELSSLVVGVSFVLPASLIYRHRRTFKYAVIGLFASVALATTTAIFTNRFMMFPLFFPAMPGDEMWYLIWTGVLPFNLIRLSLNALFTVYLYKKMAVVFKQVDKTLKSPGTDTKKTHYNQPALVRYRHMIITTIVGVSFLFMLALPTYYAFIDGQQTTVLVREYVLAGKLMVPDYHVVDFYYNLPTLLFGTRLDSNMNYIGLGRNVAGSLAFLVIFIVPVTIVAINMLKKVYTKKYVGYINIGLIVVQILMLLLVFPLLMPTINTAFTANIGLGTILACITLGLSIAPEVYSLVKQK